MSLIIGIDPDIHESGMCVYNKESKKIDYQKIRFFQLFEWINDNKDSIDTIKIEAGWLNKKSNFRNIKYKGISDKISKDVGQNHAVGKKIVEMCEYLNVKHKLSKPLLKKWKGRDGKITHEELKKLLSPLKIELNSRTNQDVRDSILICLY